MSQAIADLKRQNKLLAEKLKLLREISALSGNAAASGDTVGIHKEGNVLCLDTTPTRTVALHGPITGGAGGKRKATAHPTTGNLAPAAAKRPRAGKSSLAAAAASTDAGGTKRRAIKVRNPISGSMMSIATVPGARNRAFLNLVRASASDRWRKDSQHTKALIQVRESLISFV